MTSERLGRSRLARWRVWVQAGFLLAWLDPLMVPLHGFCSPVFHCYSCPLATFACPIGVLAQFSALHMFPFLAVGLLVAVGAVVGSFVCGWACPFGFLQDLAAKIPTPKFELPAWTGWTRYVVLVVFVLAIPYWFGEERTIPLPFGQELPLFFCRLCPAGALEGAVPHAIDTAINGPAIAWPGAIKMIILGTFLVAMLFTWRPWCRLFCPLGAIYGLHNRVSFFFLRFHADLCRGCESCRSLCEGGGRPEARADGLQCVRCMECTRCRAVSVAIGLSEMGGGSPPKAG